MKSPQTRTAALFLSLSLATVAARAADEFTIEALDFDTGNVQVSLPGQAYASLHSCIWNAGELPNRAEYEIEFPVTADYTLFALYAAALAQQFFAPIQDAHRAWR